MQNFQDVQLAASALKARLPDWFRKRPGKSLAIILGTGLSQLARAITTPDCRVPFEELPGFPVSGVESHEGAFITGWLGDMPVLAQLGRCHLYEGRSPAQVCMGVRVMASLGIRCLVITNAAGALNPLFEVGGLMCASDMINHTGTSPLSGANCPAWGDRFPDMGAVFDPRLREMANESALELGMRLENGVYIGVHGPEMETPAETRMYRQWGADAIGMSTVLEVIAARHMGMRVLGLSCLTNKNLPDCMEPAPLEEVVRVAGIAGARIAELLPVFCDKLCCAPGFGENGPNDGHS